jgi:hypothetical protein
MKTENDEPVCCPYCDNPSPTFTEDHVFPQFLGGRRTIRVCRDCNNTFGHTFEGSAAKHLKRLQVFISSFGLDLTRVPGAWPSALTIGDVTYDLISGPEGAQYKLCRPTIRRDADGRITGGMARSVAEANQIAKGMMKADLAKEMEISEASCEQIDDVFLTVPTSFDSDLYRFATKLVAAVLVNFGYQEFISSSGIGAYLHAKAEWQTTPAYCDIAGINEMSPPLSHAVYVELGTPSYGIVVIFGHLKVFVSLPPSPIKKAYLATLDPIDGEEGFSEVASIGPRSVPITIRLTEMMAHLNEMNRMLMQAAILRGAKRPPILSIEELNPGPPQFFSQTDSTLRFMFPSNKSLDKKD